MCEVPIIKDPKQKGVIIELDEIYNLKHIDYATNEKGNVVSFSLARNKMKKIPEIIINDLYSIENTNLRSKVCVKFQSLRIPSKNKL